MTLADAIELISPYSVGDESTDNISNAQLTLLSSLTSSRVTRLNPGFTGDELTFFQAYIVLDAYEGSNGQQIIKESVKDNSWQYKDSSSSTHWLDKAYLMIAEYKQDTATNVSLSSGVSRCDSSMSNLRFDSTTPKQYGEPSESDYL